MAARRKVRVFITRNFERNLSHIEEFLERAGAGAAFDDLLHDLDARVVPLLEVSPRLGAPFPSERAGSREARLLLRKIEGLLRTDELRQLVRGEYLVLYLVTRSAVHMLAVKHGREKSFLFPDAPPLHR